VSITTELVRVERDELALVDDPTAYTEMALGRAIGWLQEARTGDELREAKAVAATMETFIRQRELGFDAQRNASEMVTRVQVEIAKLERATVPRRGEIGRGRDRSSAPEVLTGGRRAQEDKALAEATSEQLDEAIADVRAEGKAPTPGAVARTLKPSRKRRAPNDLVDYLPDLTPGGSAQGELRTLAVDWCRAERPIAALLASDMTLSERFDEDWRPLLVSLDRVISTAEQLKEKINSEV
jgi:hypothetical protein